jgi:hypothetical protein
MQSPAREAWRRLPWTRWLARGTLLGLCAATVLALAIFPNQRETLVIRHPLLAQTWWIYMALGAATLLTLLAVLSRLRHAAAAMALLSVIVLVFELLVLGTGPHLLRIPVSLLLVIWADRVLRQSQPTM